MIASSTGHITIFVLDARKNVLGMGIVSLRACRQIWTGTQEKAGKHVGWYVPHIDIAVQVPGRIDHLTIVLPNGEMVRSPVEDFGLTKRVVRFGQAVTIDDLRVVHPLTTPVVVNTRQ